MEVDDPCTLAPYNDECGVTPFGIEADATWAVRTTLSPVSRSTTWSVSQRVRFSRQTFWDVRSECRGTRSFFPYDQGRILLRGGKIESALVPHVTLCQLSPRTKSRLATRDHTGKYAIVAQTNDLFLDQRGYVYIKTSGAFLGALGALDATRIGPYADQVARLRRVDLT